MSKKSQNSQKESVLECDALTLTYGRKSIFSSLHLQFSAGEIVVLLGENGAGKSSLLKLLWGYLQPTRGHVLLSGREVHKIPKAQIPFAFGYLSQSSQYPLGYSVAEYIQMAGYPIGVDFHAQSALFDWVVRDLDLWDLKDRALLDLSGGERQRAKCARLWLQACLVSHPLVLLIDEFETHLDTHWKNHISKIWIDLASQGSLVILAGHDQALYQEMAQEFSEPHRIRFIQLDNL